MGGKRGGGREIINCIASKLSADKLSRLREQSVGWNIKCKLKTKADCKIIML